MDKGHASTIRPPDYLRVHDRATAVLTIATQAAQLAPPRQTLVRKWRAKHGGQPSPLERLMGLVVELHRAGIGIATLRQIPQALHDLLDDLTVGVARPKLTLGALRREMALEHVENAAALDLMVERTPETLTAFAAASRAEAMHQLELARAAEAEAREMRRTMARSA